MTEIFCKCCSQYLNESEFYSYNSKIKKPCKLCKRKYQSLYYKDNKNEIKSYHKEYYNLNKIQIVKKQLIRDRNRKYDISKYQKSYRINNKISLQKKKRHYINNRKQQSIYRLRFIVSNAVYQALKLNNSNKNGNSIISSLEYTINDLKNHLESKFEYWMNWNNWGQYNSKTWIDNDPSTWFWNIDHIIPQSKLPYSSMQDDNFKKCWELENLRPYSAKQNIIDGKRK